jgi:hypothetical protein
MLSKKITALAAGALLVASTSAVAQTANPAAPLSTAAMLQSGDDGGIDSTSAIAIGFVLIVAAILIATAGGGKDEPETPVSP